MCAANQQNSMKKLRMLGTSIIKHTRYKSEQSALSKAASELVTAENNHQL